MKVQPRSNNAITIILDNGDEFELHTPNEKELVFSRPQRDKRNYRIALANIDDASWVHEAEHWMIRLTKGGLNEDV